MRIVMHRGFFTSRSDVINLRTLSFLLVLLVPCLSCEIETNRLVAGRIFDVTKYGASPHRRDNRDAFLAAWRAACSFRGRSIVLVPRGSFLLGPVSFQGPCSDGRSPTVLIHGHVKALPRLSDYHADWWISFLNLDHLTVAGGGVLDGQGAKAWPLNSCHQNAFCRMLPTTLDFTSVQNASVSGLTLVNSKAFHVKLHRCVSVRVYNLNISSPERSPNTDGIHLGITDNIEINNVIIGTGDDCISIGPGSTNVAISNVVCGPGHGISIGSLGKYDHELDVSGVHVRRCLIRNTSNGLRIKTWPGSRRSRVSNLTFEDIAMMNVTNPIIIDQMYCPDGNCTREPSHVMISNITYRRISGTSNQRVAVNLLCSAAVPCNNVQMEDIAIGYTMAWYKTTSNCSSVDGSYSGVQIPAPCFMDRRQRQRLRNGVSAAFQSAASPEPAFDWFD